MIREISLFVEDTAHEKVIGTLVQRIADSHGVSVRLNWRNAVGGYSQVVGKFGDYLRDLERQGGYPDLIVVATDANCSGLNERVRQLERPETPVPIVMAIPDPHVERWLLLDGEAFRQVLGHGCNAPDQKCDRDVYKQRLIRAILDAGIEPSLGGIEFAEDIVSRIDIPRAERADDSFRRFVRELSQYFQQWGR